MKTNVPDRVFQTHKSQGTVDKSPELCEGQLSWIRATKDYRFYDDTAQEKMMREHFPDLYPLWARLPLPVMKADVWRYAVVYKYGGIYADADTKYLRPSTSLFRAPCLLTVMPEASTCPRSDGVCNWWFSAPARSPVLRHVLECIKGKLTELGDITSDMFRNDYHLIHAATGPHAMTEGVRRWAESVGWQAPSGVREWEMHREARRLGLCVFPHTSMHEKVVLHMFSSQWDGGWIDQRNKYAGLTEEEWNARNKKR